MSSKGGKKLSVIKNYMPKLNAKDKFFIEGVAAYLDTLSEPEPVGSTPDYGYHHKDYVLNLKVSNRLLRRRVKFLESKLALLEGTRERRSYRSMVIPPQEHPRKGLHRTRTHKIYK